MMERESYPRESLRHRLSALGIPEEAHGFRTLSSMLPVRLDEAPLYHLEADTLAETLIYLIGKEIIRPPARLEGLIDFDWGGHVCQLYRSTDELLEFQIPYFRKGLENGEYCFWVAAPPSTAETNREALACAVPGFGHHERAIEFIDYDDWYVDESGEPRATEVMLSHWHSKVQHALDLGYRGLRCSGDTCWIDQRSHSSGFLEYENQVSAAMERQRMKAVCAYPLSGCTPWQIHHVLQSHEEMFVKRDDWWHRIAAADVNEAKAVLMALQGGKP